MHTEYLIQMDVSMEECFSFFSLSIFSHILNALGYDMWRWDLKEVLDLQLNKIFKLLQLEAKRHHRRKPI